MKVNLLDYEKPFWEKGQYVCGVDEVAYGNLFGSLFISAVIFPFEFDFSQLPKLKDSKKVKDADRFQLEKVIKDKALWWCCEEVDVDTINKETAYHAKYRVIGEAINLKASHLNSIVVIMDGNVKITNLNKAFESECLIKGDSLCKTISAASIIAKCHQRRHIIDLSKIYPYYDLDKNNGYFSKAHKQGILEYGATAYHRKAYIKNILKES